MVRDRTRRRVRHGRGRGLAAVLLFACSLSACGDQSLSGTITIRGSTTMLPMLSEVSRTFAAEHPFVEFDVDMVGSRDGIVQLCGGVVPIAGASRPMTDDELEDCRASGVDVVRFHLANDGVVVLSRSEPRLGCISLDQLYAAAGPESVGTTTWTDVARIAGESGATLPSGNFELVGPGPNSGSVSVFEELALGPPATDRGTEPTIRSDYTRVISEQAILNALSSRPGALGFVGFTTARDWRNRVDFAAVDAGSGCVPANSSTLAKGTYPLRRDLDVLVDARVADRDPVVRAYVDWLLSDEGAAAIRRSGSVPVERATIERARVRWADALARTS